MKYLNEFLSQIGSNVQFMPSNAQKIKPEVSTRTPFIGADHAVLVFKAVHGLFDKLKHDENLCVLRARKFIAQPLYILAGFYNIQKASQLYCELYPELTHLKVTPLKTQSRIALDENAMQFDPIDYLCKPFEFELLMDKSANEPILTNTQRNKLK
jgi:hypothetical protein